MSLCLVVHDGTEAGAEALEAALWEVSDSHWAIGCGFVVDTDVSPSYLGDHLRRALRRAGWEAHLLVAPLEGDLVLDGLPPEGRDWMRERLAL